MPDEQVIQATLPAFSQFLILVAMAKTVDDLLDLCEQIHDRDDLNGVEKDWLFQTIDFRHKQIDPSLAARTQN